MIQQFFSLLVSVVALSLGFYLLERLRPAERGQPLAHSLSNLLYAPFILAFVLVSGVLAAPAFSLMLAQAGGGLLPVFAGPGSGIAAQILFALVYAFVWDLSQYAMHRAQHAFPALWETHRLHHDETALNGIAQARVHPTSYLLAMAFHAPVVVLFGPQVPHFVATFVMFRLFGFMNHSNLRIGLGPAAILVSNPQWHRIHHSVHAAHRDRNFATFFPVIDWMFGTYYAPQPGEYPPTGLGEEPRTPLGVAMIRPFRVWGRMIGTRYRRLATALHGKASGPA